MRRCSAARPRASTRLVPWAVPLEVRLLPSNVLTYHEDNTRSGWDSTETVLNPTDVNAASFGKLFNMPVDGKVDAQPLYVAGVTIPGQGVHNVLYVATEHDTVYAFDADNGVRLWKASMLPKGEVPSDPVQGLQITPEIGITSTPVIDPATGTMYLVAMSKSFSGGVATYHQRLHAISIATGADVIAPHSIDQSITFPGSGPGGNGSVVIFNPEQYKERSALLLSNGIIDTGWASHSDVPPYTGWVIGFRASDLSLAYVLNIDPAGQPVSTFLDDGSGNTFWNSGNGFAADAQGNLYNISANGPFDPVLNAAGFPTNGDYGDSFLKLTPANGTLAVADYFTPANQQLLADQDFDVGSSGIALADVPGPGGVVEHLAVGSDKLGNVYVVDRDSMGGFHPSGDTIHQEIVGGLHGGLWGSPTVYGGLVYFGGWNAPLQEFGFFNGLLVPLSQSSHLFGYPGTTVTVSSNGVTNGIVWAAENSPNAVLHAYLATDVSVELYNSSQAANGRDLFGAGNKFITPVIANGRVYVATASGVAAFGLLPTPPPTFVLPPTAGARSVVGNSFPLATLASDAAYPESLLTYTWATLSAPPGAAPAVFSGNGSGAARSTVATVSVPGQYIFLVVVADPSGNRVDCVTVVNVTAPAASSTGSARAIVPASRGATRPSAVVATPSAATASTPPLIAGDGPVPMTAAPTAASVAAPIAPVATLSSTGAGRITLVPQGPAGMSTPAPIRPRGDRKPFAPSSFRRPPA